MALVVGLNTFDSDNDLYILSKNLEFIKINVVRNKHSQVMLGVVAPVDFLIFRKKILKRILNEDNGESLGIPPGHPLLNELFIPQDENLCSRFR